MEKLAFLAKSFLTIIIVIVLVELIYFSLIKYNKIKPEKGLKPIIIRIILVIFYYELIIFIIFLILSFKQKILDNFLGSDTIPKIISEFILSLKSFLILLFFVEIYKYFEFNGKTSTYVRSVFIRLCYLLVGYVFLSFIVCSILLYFNNIFYSYLSTSKKITETFSKPLTIFIVVFIVLCIILWKLMINKKILKPIIKAVLVLIGIMIVLIEYYVSNRILISLFVIVFFGWLIFGILDSNE